MAGILEMSIFGLFPIEIFGRQVHILTNPKKAKKPFELIVLKLRMISDWTIPLIITEPNSVHKLANCNHHEIDTGTRMICKHPSLTIQ